MTIMSILVKASILLLVVAIAHALLGRRTSAATRHLAWTFAIIGLLLLPILSAVLPRWTAVRLPALRPAVIIAPAEVETSAVVPPSAASAPSDTLPAGRAATRRAWSAVLPTIYAAGVLLWLVRLIAERLSIRRLERHASMATEPEWQRLLLECAARAGVHRSVRLLRSHADTMPMSFGILRPVIVLPPVADTWSDDRRRAVLLHELAHVARHDCLTQMLAALTCALYWVHPGVWWAARRLRVERELACDDRVIAAGADARDYAGHLLEVAYALGGRRAPALAVSMAGRRQLEGRMIAAMDAARNRATPALRSRLTGVIILAALVLPVAAATATVIPMQADAVRNLPSLVNDIALAMPVMESAPALRPEGGTAGQVSVSTSLAIAAAAQSGRLPWTGEYIQWTGSVEQGQTVQIRGLHGSIRAVNSDDGIVHVEAHLVRGAEVPIDVVHDARGVTICVDQCQSAAGSRNRFLRNRADETEIDFTVRIPAGVRFSGATVSGNIFVEELRSDVNVATVEGDVRIQKTAGFATHATTVSGDVIVAIPVGDGADFRATTVSGKIESDVPLELNERGRRFAPPPPPPSPGPFGFGGPRPPNPPMGPVSGTIGNGGPEIRVTTVSGKIELRQR